MPGIHQVVKLRNKVKNCQGYLVPSERYPAITIKRTPPLHRNEANKSKNGSNKSSLLFYLLSMLSFLLLHSSLQQSFTSVTAISGCGWNTHPHMEEVGVGLAWSLWRRGFGFATPQTAIRRNRSMLADEEHHSISCNATGFLEAFWNKYFLSKSSDFQSCLSK